MIKCGETSFYRQPAHQGKLGDLRGHENISEVSLLAEEKTDLGRPSADAGGALAVCVGSGALP